MERLWQRGLIIIGLALLVQTNPVYLRGRQADVDQRESVSVTPWNGHGKIKSAYLISRITLKQANSACQDLATSLDVAHQIIQTLNDSNLVDSNNDQIQRFSYSSLKLENIYLDIFDYIESLDLCDNLPTILTKYGEFKVILDTLWEELTDWGQNLNRSSTPAPFNPLADALTAWAKEFERSSPLKLPPNHDHNKIVNSLNNLRPVKNTQSSPALLVGLGLSLGAAGASLISKLFRNNNDQEIKTLNDNINKVNNKLIITNERIDMLAKNVSNAISDVKLILDKMVTVRYQRNVYAGILWNLDQISETLINIRLSFRISEMVITMLESGIINPDLIKVETFQKIIEEGLKTFPQLEFPIDINRHYMQDILKLVEVKKAGHNKFLMITPLFSKTKYNIYNMVPHPISIRTETLIPETTEIILVDELNYIITEPKNIHSINNETHVLNSMEPIWKGNKTSCDWVSFNQNLTEMLKLCNYKRVRTTDGITLTELKNIRLAFFPEETVVELDCPDGKVRDKIAGLHKLPLECDVTTAQVHWPAREEKEINIERLVTIHNSFDITSLPIIKINEYDQVSEDLKNLISELPNEDAFTFAFKEASLEEVKTYSIIAYGTLSATVMIHSIIISIMLLIKAKKWWTNRQQMSKRKILQRLNEHRDSFKNMRDSVRLRGRKWRGRARSLRSHSPSISMRSLNSRSSSLTSLKSRVKKRVRKHSPFGSPKVAHAGTNTEIRKKSIRKYKGEKVPPLPRYNT